MRNLYCYIIVCILLVISGVSSISAETLSQDLLRQQALAKLETLDQGDYQLAWFAMSPLFRALNDEAEWQNRHQLIRSAYGPVIFRQFLRLSFRDTYTHSPDGQYVLIQYRTSFVHKINAIETIVMDCSDSRPCTVRHYIIN